MLILASTVSGCVSITAFASLSGVPVGITSSAAMKSCAITPGIKKFKSSIKKKRKKRDKIILLRKTQFNAIKVLISKAIIGSYISHDELFSVIEKLVLAEYNEMKKEIKNPETSVEYTNKYGSYKQRKV